MTTAAAKPTTREALLAAARAVALEEGLTAVTVRSVAKRAKVSPGSVIYHFAAFDELVLEAVDGTLRLFTQQRIDLAEQVTDVRERISAFIALGLPLEIDDDVRLVYEALAFVRNRPALAYACRSVVESQVQVYLTTIEIGTRLGDFAPVMRPLVIAQHLVALEDAYDLYPILGLPQDRRQIRENTVAVAEMLLGTELPRGPLES